MSHNIFQANELVYDKTVIDTNIKVCLKQISGMLLTRWKNFGFYFWLLPSSTLWKENIFGKAKSSLKECEYTA